MVIQNIEEYIQRFEEIGKCPVKRQDGNPCYSEAKEISIDRIKVCSRHKKNLVRIHWRVK